MCHKLVKKIVMDHIIISTPTDLVINPYCTTVPVRGRQNHVVLQTSYLRNGKELDRNIQNFFEAEEIYYNMSKF